MKNILFVSGMFRSGTTLLGRILDAHPQITVASDPYLPFFKILRSRLAKQLNQEIPYSSPLDDYYFDNKKLALFREIQKADFTLPFEELPVLRQMVKAYGEPYSPLLIPFLEELEGKNFREIFYSMVKLVNKVYGSEKTTITGFKEVWADEFIPALINSVAEIKVIQIIRDPRAVCASKNSSEELYPWLFLIRQWRKSAALAHKYSQPEFRQKISLVYYENLVNNPYEEINKICNFLDIPFENKMLDLTGLKDGSGRQWKQNTTYGEGITGFNKSSTEKWKEVLTGEEISLIETLCYPEMLLHNYYVEDTGFEGLPVLSAPRVYDAKIAEWIKNIVPNDKVTTTFEMAKELVRYNLLSSDESNNDLIESCFLFNELFESVKNELC